MDGNFDVNLQHIFILTEIYILLHFLLRPGSWFLTVMGLSNHNHNASCFVNVLIFTAPCMQERGKKKGWVHCNSKFWLFMLKHQVQMPLNLNKLMKVFLQRLAHLHKHAPWEIDLALYLKPQIESTLFKHGSGAIQRLFKKHGSLKKNKNMAFKACRFNSGLQWSTG